MKRSLNEVVVIPLQQVVFHQENHLDADVNDGKHSHLQVNQRLKNSNLVTLWPTWQWKLVFSWWTIWKKLITTINKGSINPNNNETMMMMIFQWKIDFHWIPLVSELFHFYSFFIYNFFSDSKLITWLLILYINLYHHVFASN